MIGYASQDLFALGRLILGAYMPALANQRIETFAIPFHLVHLAAFGIAPQHNPEYLSKTSPYE